MKINNWLVFAAIVALDQVSKKIILSRPEWADSIITNSGLPFVGEAVTGVFVLVVIALALVLFLVSYRLFLDGKRNRTAFALIVGGAVSNLVDRITRGAVIDFLDVGFGGKFNLADVAIWVGIVLLLYNLFAEEKVPEKPR